MPTPEHRWPDKDPQDEADFTIDWTDEMLTASPVDHIVAASWAVPAGLTFMRSTHQDSLATVWISGGTVPEIYNLTCTITTALGRTLQRTVALRVRER